MSDTLSAADRAELHTQLFANLVMQHASMALIYLGASPHPETGKTMFDLDGAQHFIDTLEMIEARSKGNLSTDESAILKQALSTARMAFVQAVEHGAPKETPAESKAVAPEPVAPEPDANASAKPAGDEEERKKFVKKY